MITPSERRSLFLRGLIRFLPVDETLKCDCGNPATHFKAHGRSCDRCYNIEQHLQDFHTINRTDLDNYTDWVDKSINP